MYVYIYIYIYIYMRMIMLLVIMIDWRPDGLTIHAKRWFLGAGFLGATPISLVLHMTTYYNDHKHKCGNNITIMIINIHIIF